MLGEDEESATEHHHERLRPSHFRPPAKRTEYTLNSTTVRSEMLLDINYKGLHVQSSYRLDLLVEESVIVEVKSVRLLQDIHKAQLLTYLRLHGAHVGLLLNFNVPLLRDGIPPWWTGLPPSYDPPIPLSQAQRARALR